jgi:hypothetical protein
MSSSKIPDIEKLMTERSKDYPGLKIRHVSKPSETAEHNFSSERHIKATVDMEKIKLEDEAISKMTQAEPPSATEYEHPLADAHNDMDRYIKPSEYLKRNVLPSMDDFLIDYNLSLDIRHDAVSTDNHIPEYSLQFTRFGNISRMELISIIISFHHSLLMEPYLFIDIKEIEGRCHLSNGKRTFGKIMTMAKRDGHLIYVPEECVQTFSKPIYLEKLTLSVCDHHGTPINIKEIKVGRVLKSKSNSELVIECCHQHFLNEREKIEVQIIKSMEIESYEVEVKSIIDEKKFKIKNSFDNITPQMRIFRTNVIVSVTFKLSEINWFMLSDKSFQTIQLIQLSQMVKDKTKSIADEA